MIVLSPKRFICTCSVCPYSRMWHKQGSCALCIWNTYVKHICVVSEAHMWPSQHSAITSEPRTRKDFATLKKTITRKRYGKRPCLVGWNCLQVLQHLRKLLRQSTGVQYVMNVSTVGDFDRCIRLYIHEAVSPDFSYVARPQPRLFTSGFRILKPFPRTCVSVASSQVYC